MIETPNIVNDIVGTLKQYGYNCDRSNITIMVSLALEREKEYKNRLKSINHDSNLTIPVRY